MRVVEFYGDEADILLLDMLVRQVDRQIRTSMSKKRMPVVVCLAMLLVNVCKDIPYVTLLARIRALTIRKAESSVAVAVV